MARAKGSKTTEGEETKARRPRAKKTAGDEKAERSRNRQNNISEVATQIIDSTANMVKDEIEVMNHFDPLNKASSKRTDPSKIVADAATILSEEIKRGFDTANELGSQLGKMNSLTLPDEETVERFRSQAHSAVDAVVNLVNLAANPATGIANSLLSNITGSDNPAVSSEPSSGVPSFSVGRTVKAGESIQISMTLENEGSSATESFNMFCSDLLSPTGRIDAGSVSFEPSKVVLRPNETKKVKVVIDVPVNTDAGTYSGLIQSTQEEGMRAVLSVRVV